MSRRKLIVGNWKMHGSHQANAELLAAIVGGRPYLADVAVCVPFPYLSETAVTLAASDIRWGSQDCSAHEQGAYTGEVSAAMLREFGVRYAIVGHSERRQYHGETDALVAEKAKAALAHGMAEHRGRYVDAIRRFTAAGIACFTFDLRGHGFELVGGRWVDLCRLREDED